MKSRKNKGYGSNEQAFRTRVKKMTYNGFDFEEFEEDSFYETVESINQKKTRIERVEWDNENG